MAGFFMLMIDSKTTSSHYFQYGNLQIVSQYISNKIDWQ